MLLKRITNDFWYNDLVGVVSTATGDYDAASTLPQLHTLEPFLDIIEDQRAPHLSRHPNLSVHHVFDEEEMKDMWNLWMSNHISWLRSRKLVECEKLRLKGPPENSNLTIIAAALGSILFLSKHFVWETLDGIKIEPPFEGRELP